MDFKEWWGKEEFFGGVGCMAAAELAWDHQADRITELEWQLSHASHNAKKYAQECIESEAQSKKAKESTQRALSDASRRSIELRLIRDILEEGEEFDPSSTDYDYMTDLHDKLRVVVLQLKTAKRDAILEAVLATAEERTFDDQVWVCPVGALEDYANSLTGEEL